MTLRKPLAATAIFVVTTTAALAGAPDNPGERGAIIDFNKTTQQNNSGSKNGWGQAVADRAKNGSASGAKNLGDFLKFMAGGPNPHNDNGRGND